MSDQPPVVGPRTEALLAQMTLDEKAAVTAGSGFFELRGVPRLGLADLHVTDGPNGARGSSFLGSGEAEAVCIPCGTALGATWNPSLVEELGALLGDETRTKQSRVLLAPTVNLHRSPLAGRNFECFSEDPLLTGKLAAAYIRGVQSRGVITTVKHFVGNDAEFQRNTVSSEIDERTLRELYLVPFELAVKEGHTLGVMTGYNRLNGTFCAAHPWLLTKVLRQEWGYDGFVMTDWFSGGDTVGSALAGLDIEMPGGDRAYGKHHAVAVADGRLDESVLEAMVTRQLNALERMNALDDEPGPEVNVDRAEFRALSRRAAAEAIVLLRNDPVGEAPILPLAPSRLRSIAVIGQNSARAQIMGGGSANLRPFHRTSPLATLRARLGDTVSIIHERGCSIDRTAPNLQGDEITAANGQGGFVVEVFDTRDWVGQPIGTTSRDTSRLFVAAEAIPGSGPEFSVRATTAYTPTQTGVHSFELVQISHGRVRLDGQLILDGVTNPPPIGGSFFGIGSEPMTAPVDLVGGRTYELVIEMQTVAGGLFSGLDFGVRIPPDPDGIARAVAAATAADVAIVVVGTNDDWETEGEDRTTLALPGDQDTLVRAVLAANPRTVVVVNTGAPVELPWAAEAPAILQSWFGGQEMADALVDVLVGDRDPGGRLPTTFPVRLEHNPSFGNFPGSNGSVRYGEGVLIGYRWYDTRHLPVLFPFGHGLSYTDFAIGAPELSARAIGTGEGLTVRVPVTNTGSRPGSTVVQCYVAPHQSRLDRPTKELKAFGKVELAPGESITLTFQLDDRSFSYYDPAQPEWPALRQYVTGMLPMTADTPRRTEPGWTIDNGTYDIVIATSATEEHHRATVTSGG